MATFTAGMLSTANIFIKDIFEPWYVRRNNILPGPKLDHLIILAARLFMMFLAAVTVVVCFYPPPFIWNLINVTLGLFLPVLPNVLVGTWMARRNASRGTGGLDYGRSLSVPLDFLRPNLPPGRWVDLMRSW